jgi:DNA-binding LytR/AlgR family response regulator
LPIRTPYAVKLIRIEEIDYAESRNRRVFVRAGEAEYPAQYSLKQLEALLPADCFFRLHDSYVVNLERVEEVSNLGSQTYQVRLASGVRLPVGRTRYAELRRRLAIGEETVR